MIPFSIKNKIQTKHNGDDYYKKVILGNIDGRQVKWVKRNTYELESKGFWGLNPQSNQYTIVFKDYHVEVTTSNDYTLALSGFSAMWAIGMIMYDFFSNDILNLYFLVFIPIVLVFSFLHLAVGYFFTWPTIKEILKRIKAADDPAYIWDGEDFRKN